MPKQQKKPGPHTLLYGDPMVKRGKYMYWPTTIKETGKPGPFMKVDMSDDPEQLKESEAKEKQSKKANPFNAGPRKAIK